jgi:hypothetical protein
MNKANGSVLCIAVLALGSAVAAPQETKVLRPSELTARTDLILKPTITEVRNKCLPYTDEMDIKGLGFGATQGKRQVIVDGKSKEVWVWGKTAIKIAHHYDFPAGKMIKVYLRDGTTSAVVSNEFEFFNLFCLMRVTPEGPVSPGATVEIMVLPSVGADPLGRGLLIGGMPATITFWNENTIRAVVPALAPGEHRIWIRNRAMAVSAEYPITVH